MNSQKLSKKNISLYDAVDASLKYFSKCVTMLQFTSERMEFSRRLHLANELSSDDTKIQLNNLLHISDKNLLKI